MSHPPPISDYSDAELTVRPSVFLDYGVDGAMSDNAVCEVCERGMRVQSRWQFEPGTVLSIAFRFGEDGCRRLAAEGLVIECMRLKNRDCLTTVAFLEAPEELRTALAEVNHQVDLSGIHDGCFSELRPTS